jgi:predicted DNA-binding protein with PD1-like motif
MRFAQTNNHRRFMGRFEKGDSLPQALIDFCQANDIAAGEFRAMGAVTDLAVTEWDVDASEYREPLTRKEPSEILLLYGNISLRDGDIFPHLHISASYFKDGHTTMIAGHLAKATVFACEFVLDAYDDLDLVRVADEATGLFLWGEMNRK